MSLHVSDKSIEFTEASYATGHSFYRTDSQTHKSNQDQNPRPAVANFNYNNSLTYIFFFKSDKLNNNLLHCINQIKFIFALHSDIICLF